MEVFPVGFALGGQAVAFDIQLAAADELVDHPPLTRA